VTRLHEAYQKSAVISTAVKSKGFPVLIAACSVLCARLLLLLDLRFVLRVMWFLTACFAVCTLPFLYFPCGICTADQQARLEMTKCMKQRSSSSRYNLPCAPCLLCACLLCGASRHGRTCRSRRGRVGVERDDKSAVTSAVVKSEE
jgi:hypothetical protein